jgi:hypothetical protein
MPIYHDRDQTVVFIGAIGATAPLSELSQTQDKLTTITLMAGPTYVRGSFSVGLSNNFAYTIYSSNSISSGTYYSPTGDPGSFGYGLGGSLSNAPQLWRDSGSLNLGYRISDVMRITSSAGMSYNVNEDNSYSVGTQATIGSFIYNPGPITLSATVSLISNPANNQSLTLPNQPAIGLGLQYILGSRVALTGGAPGGLGRNGGGGGGR